MTDTALPDIIDVYHRHGEAWARLRGDKLEEGSWLDRFTALLPAGSAILDIGCGSGLPIGRELVRRGFEVTGIDGTPAMLRLFRCNLPSTPSYLVDMRQLALGQRFSVLLAWDSFFHLSPDDQRPMFARFQAHAAPNAALMFTSGNEEGSAIGELEGDPLYHGSLDPTEYRELLNHAGFDVVSHVAADPTSGYRTIWLARQRGNQREVS